MPEPRDRAGRGAPRDDRVRDLRLGPARLVREGQGRLGPRPRARGTDRGGRRRGRRPGSPGDRVVPHHHAPCFACRECEAGQYVHCAEWRSSRLDPGGMAELVRIPAGNLARDTLKIPDGVSDEEASFTEPLATVVKAFRRGPIRVRTVVPRRRPRHDRTARVAAGARLRRDVGRRGGPRRVASRGRARERSRRRRGRRTGSHSPTARGGSPEAAGSTSCSSARASPR